MNLQRRAAADRRPSPGRRRPRRHLGARPARRVAGSASPASPSPPRSSRSWRSGSPALVPSQVHRTQVPGRPAAPLPAQLWYACPATRSHPAGRTSPIGHGLRRVRRADDQRRRRAGAWPSTADDGALPRARPARLHRVSTCTRRAATAGALSPDGRSARLRLRRPGPAASAARRRRGVRIVDLGDRHRPRRSALAGGQGILVGRMAWSPDGSLAGLVRPGRDARGAGPARTFGDAGGGRPRHRPAHDISTPLPSNRGSRLGSGSTPSATTARVAILDPDRMAIWRDGETVAGAVRPARRGAWSGAGLVDGDTRRSTCARRHGARRRRDWCEHVEATSPGRTALASMLPVPQRLDR